LSFILQIVILPSAIQLSIILLSFTLLSVIQLSAVIPNALAPFEVRPFNPIPECFFFTPHRKNKYFQQKKVESFAFFRLSFLVLKNRFLSKKMAVFLLKY
jgi:hypothetical protein